MSSTLHDLSRPAIIRAIEENLIAKCALLGDAAQVEFDEGPDLVRLISGVPSPLCNGIFRARFAAENCAERITAVLRVFKSQNLPMIWWVGPSTRPVDLGPRLEAAGLVHVDGSPGMAVDLWAQNGIDPARPGLAIKIVNSRRALEAWLQVFQAGFEMPEPVARFFFAAFLRLGLDDGLPVRHFIGWLDGEPVACSSVFLAAGVAGIYNVATVPNACGRGFGSAMVAATLCQAQNDGYRIAILHSTEVALSVYRRLGFEVYCDIDHYLLPGT